MPPGQHLAGEGKNSARLGPNHVSESLETSHWTLWSQTCSETSFLVCLFVHFFPETPPRRSFLDLRGNLGDPGCLRQTLYCGMPESDLRPVPTLPSPF